MTAPTIASEPGSGIGANARLSMSKLSSPPWNGPAVIVKKLNGSLDVKPKNPPTIGPSDVSTFNCPPKGNFALGVRKIEIDNPCALPPGEVSQNAPAPTSEVESNENCVLSPRLRLTASVHTEPLSTPRVG